MAAWLSPTRVSFPACSLFLSPLAPLGSLPSGLGRGAWCGGLVPWLRETPSGAALLGAAGVCLAFISPLHLFSVLVRGRSRSRGFQVVPLGFSSPGAVGRPVGMHLVPPAPRGARLGPVSPCPLRSGGVFHPKPCLMTRLAGPWEPGGRHLAAEGWGRLQRGMSVRNVPVKQLLLPPRACSLWLQLGLQESLTP